MNHDGEYSLSHRSIRDSKYILAVRLLRHNLVRLGRSATLPSILSLLLGKLLRRRFYMQEYALWQAHNFNKDISNVNIVRQTITIAKKFLLWLFVVFLLTGVTDVLLSGFLQSSLKLSQIGSLSLVSQPSEVISPFNNAVLQLTQLYVATIGTVFGLFFALYLVGFELATAGYSRDIAQYINQEQVGSLFFRWLLFALFFNLLVLLRIWLFQTPAVTGFLAATCFSAFSLLMILTYRLHNLLASRPESIISRILVDFRNGLKVVMNNKSIFYESQTLTRKAHQDVTDSTSLIWKLYLDLLEKKDTSTAPQAMLAIAYMLLSYVEAKPFIRTEHTHWFPQQIERMSRKDITLFPIATEFALRGESTVRKPVTNFNWLEERLIQLFANMIDEVAKISQTPLQEDLYSGTIKVYKELLHSSFFPDKYGRENVKKKGLFELQQFNFFGIVLAQFLDLSKQYTGSERLTIEYLNVLSFVGNTIIDGFEEYEIAKASNALVQNNQLIPRNEIREGGFGDATRELLEAYWYKLDTEIQIEGQLITPSEYVSHELGNSFNELENKVINQYFKLVLENSQAIAARPDASYDLYCFKTQLLWLKRVYYRNRDSLINLFPSIFSNKSARAIVEDDSSNIEELEYQDELNDIVLLSLNNRTKTIFEAAVLHFIVVYWNKWNYAKSPEEIIPLAISLAKIGGLTFAYSELDQDSFWVETYSAKLFEYFTKKDVLIKGFKDFTDGVTSFHYHNIAESTYYTNWYRQFEDEIKKLPVEYKSDSYSVIPDATYQHPSRFIASFSAYDGFFVGTEENSIEGYIKWLEVNYLSQARQTDSEE